MANSVDLNQMLHFAASDLGLHCLQRPICPNTMGITVHIREIKFFSLVRELLGNSVMCQGLMKFCKSVREISGNFTYQPDEARMFGPDIFVAKFIKFPALDIVREI